MFLSTTAVVLSYISMIRQRPSTIVNEIFLILFCLMNFLYIFYHEVVDCIFTRIIKVIKIMKGYRKIVQNKKVTILTVTHLEKSMLYRNLILLSSINVCKKQYV